MTQVLEVKNLSVRFETHHGTIRAVDGVSFDLHEGETLGLVGESGSGKSVTNLAMMGLVPTPPGVVEADHILFQGRDLLGLSEPEMRRIRGHDISMIFQDPMTSLNPLLTVGQQLMEVFAIHSNESKREARRLCVAGLGEVGIPHPEQRLRQYPHELSGGLRQRVMIAMALLLKPKLLVADEPTTALDVTIQAQILDLLRELQEQQGTAILLITHDLGVVAGMADRVNVMYAGKLVESCRSHELFAQPYHPYTRGLLDSVPNASAQAHEKLRTIDGQPPDLANLPVGCAFAERCQFAIDRCKQEVPELQPYELALDIQRYAACYFAGEFAMDSHQNSSSKGSS